MSKFGEIIDSTIPVLIDFYTQWDDSDTHYTDDLLKEVASALGEKARVVKIDMDKNGTLASALRIKVNPTFIVYKNAEMLWRQSGKQDADTLINIVEQFVS